MSTQQSVDNFIGRQKLMNIWLDTNLFSQHLINENSSSCPADCAHDDGCPNEAPPVALTPSDVPVTFDFLGVANIRNLPTHTFICPDTLYTQRLEDTRWLVCKLACSGMVAVLDEDAYALLLRFRHHQHTLQAVLDDFSGSSASATNVIALLTRAGFLLDLDQPSPAAPSASQETLAA